MVETINAKATGKIHTHSKNEQWTSARIHTYLNISQHTNWTSNTDFK